MTISINKPEEKKEKEKFVPFKWYNSEKRYLAHTNKD